MIPKKETCCSFSLNCLKAMDILSGKCKVGKKNMTRTGLITKLVYEECQRVLADKELIKHV